MSIVHVAVGVIFDSEKKVCIAKRPDGKHLAGLWEFPGGKVEQDETVFEALKRELTEELSILIKASQELIQITHEYPTKKVLLDVHTIDDFSGLVMGNENQLVKWVSIAELANYQFPEANEEIIQSILSHYE